MAEKRQVPQNTRLWNMLVAQARQKFKTYPSLPASRWVHEQYVQKGGRFVTSTKENDEHDTKGDRNDKKPAKKTAAKKRR
jgi:hypothetical protein